MAKLIERPYRRRSTVEPGFSTSRLSTLLPAILQSNSSPMSGARSWISKMLASMTISLSWAGTLYWRPRCSRACGRSFTLNLPSERYLKLRRSQASPSGWLSNSVVSQVWRSRPSPLFRVKAHCLSRSRKSVCGSCTSWHRRVRPITFRSASVSSVLSTKKPWRTVSTSWCDGMSPYGRRSITPRATPFK